MILHNLISDHMVLQREKPIYIFGMTKRTVTPDIYSLSTLLFVSVLLLLILSNILQGHAERKEARLLRAKARAKREKKGGRVS